MNDSAKARTSFSFQLETSLARVPEPGRRHMRRRACTPLERPRRGRPRSAVGRCRRASATARAGRTHPEARAHRVRTQLLALCLAGERLRVSTAHHEHSTSGRWRAHPKHTSGPGTSSQRHISDGSSKPIKHGAPQPEAHMLAGFRRGRGRTAPRHQGLYWCSCSCHSRDALCPSNMAETGGSKHRQKGQRRAQSPCDQSHCMPTVSTVWKRLFHKFQGVHSHGPSQRHRRAHAVQTGAEEEHGPGPAGAGVPRGRRGRPPALGATIMPPLRPVGAGDANNAGIPASLTAEPAPGCRSSPPPVPGAASGPQPRKFGQCALGTTSMLAGVHFREASGESVTHACHERTEKKLTAQPRHRWGGERFRQRAVLVPLVTHMLICDQR